MAMGYANYPTSSCGVAIADEAGGVEGAPNVESTTNEEEARAMTRPAECAPFRRDAVQTCI